jgi:sulfite reductase (NADPH) flavoprotein alpha-component
MPLTLPPNAPFNGVQKVWLKGFLDGISSVFPPTGGTQAPPDAEVKANGRLVSILWGSQTGNSEALGKKLSKSLTAKGHSPTLIDMAHVSAADLVNHQYLLLITSTYGDGEPPDNAAALHSALAQPDSPMLNPLRFAVLALGDSNYPDFCKCGHDFHSRLAARGAVPMLPVTEADVDYDEVFASWLQQVEDCLAHQPAA